MKKLVRSVENHRPVPINVSDFAAPFYLSPNQKAELFISDIEQVSAVKTIEDAVIAHNGVWPKEESDSCFGVPVLCECIQPTNLRSVGDIVCCGEEFRKEYFIRICNQQEFESTAKRMGYINGYLWGKEYATNGERPDLPDDVLIDVKTGFSNKWLGWVDMDVSDAAWTSDDNAYPATHFKVIDPRYKPAEESANHIAEANEKVGDSWYERGELPPVDSEIEVFTENEEVRAIHVVWSGDNVVFGYDLNAPFIYAHFSALAYKFRPIRTEREKFIDAATTAAIIGDDKSVKLNPCIIAAFERLFDAGFRGPEVEK